MLMAISVTLQRFGERHGMALQRQKSENCKYLLPGGTNQRTNRRIISSLFGPQQYVGVG